jgi:ATP-dependent Lon protease
MSKKSSCKHAGRSHANSANIARNAQLRVERHARTIARRQARHAKTMTVELDDCTIVGVPEVVRHLVPRQLATEQPVGLKDQLKAVKREIEERQAYEWAQYAHRIDSMRDLCSVVFKGRDDIQSYAMSGGLHNCCADVDDYGYVMQDLRFARTDAAAYRRAVIALCDGKMVGIVPHAIELATAA